MGTLARVPPGRSGRMWLRRRLATAERGRDQLDRTLRALNPVLDERRAELAARRVVWRDACAEARTWLLRLGLLAGQDAVRSEPWARGAPAAEVEVVWRTTLGVTYPADARLARVPDRATVTATAAHGPAVEAFRHAVVAGASAAAAEAAVRLLEDESARTRRRLRALEKRWLPWLAEQLRDRELALAQAEQEEGVRLRRRLAGDGGPVPR